MAYDGKYNKMRRREATGMEELMMQFLREMKLTSGVNRQRAVEAWNSVSGASRYTLSVTLDRKVMTCAINSSLVRNQLYFQRDVLLKKINEFLMADSLFESPSDGTLPVRMLVLK